jgi:hypothetical protein
VRIDCIERDVMSRTISQLFGDSPIIAVLKMSDVGETATDHANCIFSAYFREHAAEKG